MAIFRALQTLAKVEGGEYNSATLDTLLSNPARYSEWQVLCGMKRQFDRMMAGGVRDIVLGSNRAWAAMSSSVHPFIYEPESLYSIAPSAWGVYVPHGTKIENTGFVARWANALGDSTRDFTQGTLGNRPTADHNASLLPKQPALTFATDDYMVCGTNFNQATAYTILAVYRRRSPSGSSTMLLGVGASSSSAQGLMAGGNTTVSVSVMNGTAIDQFPGAQSPVGEWQLARFRRESANVLYYSLNGGPEILFPSPVAIPSLNGTLWLGRGWTLFSDMDMAELWMLAGNGDASSNEVQRITAVLKAKYNL